MEDRTLLATVVWDGGVGGTGTDWHVAANWVGDQLPGAADDAQIGTTGNTIQIGANVSIKSLTSTSALAITGGTFAASTTATVTQDVTLNGGQINVGTGFTVNSNDLRLQAGSVTGALTLNTGHLELSGDVPATVIVNGTSTLSGNVSATQTVVVQGIAAGDGVLTAANAFTNNGTIRLESTISTDNATLAVTNGTLTNSATGVIDSAVASGGGRTIHLQQRRRVVFG